MEAIFYFLQILVLVYVAICLVLYFLQERFIFHPEKLSLDHQFEFPLPFEERFMEMKDGTQLHGLLFRSKESRGLIFYLHGNRGSVDTWGGSAKIYTDLHYDVFMLDYRGYGKSEGSIRSQIQLYRDLKFVYKEFLKEYREEDVIILGYSIGSGLAAKLASLNKPKMLILQAPYYNLRDLMRRNYPLIPTFILKYKFNTNKYLKYCKMPVYIFHGDRDEVIYYESSQKLRLLLKKSGRFITLKEQGHSGITENMDYQEALKTILK